MQDMNTTAIPEWFANAISQSRTSHYLHYENLKVVHYVKYSPEKHSTNKELFLAGARAAHQRGCLEYHSQVKNIIEFIS